MKFTKMHGTGNDYIYVNGFIEKIENTAEFAIKYSDRHKGIGSDGLVMIMPSDTCDFRMRMFNADGSESENTYTTKDLPPRLRLRWKHWPA